MSRQVDNFYDEVYAPHARLIKSLAFSAILKAEFVKTCKQILKIFTAYMIIGALVLPEVTFGMTEASMTRKFFTP